MQKTRLLLAALASLAGLYACGGGGGGGGSAASGTDAFTAVVQSTVAGASDTTEPASIDNITVVETDAEPVPVT